MKKRRINPKEVPTQEELIRLGLQDADPDDPLTKRIVQMHGLMGEPPAPRPRASKEAPRIAQARSHKTRPASIEPVRRQLAEAWNQWFIAKSPLEREKIRRNQIVPLEKTYYWIADRIPNKEWPSGIGQVKLWKGRIYRANPIGLNPAQAVLLFNHFSVSEKPCSASEKRDRFLVYLWALRRHGGVTVGIPVSRGRPKTRCADCANVHLVSARSRNMKILGCPSCGSRRHTPFDQCATRPGSERTIRITQKDLSHRFRVSRQHLRTIIKRYPLPQELQRLPRTAVTKLTPSTPID
jgi:hypothetical protein